MPYFIGRDGRVAATFRRSAICLAGLQALAVLLVHAMALGLVLSRQPHQLRNAGALTLLAGPSMIAYYYGTGLLQSRHRFVAFNLLYALPSFMYGLTVAALFVLQVGDLFRVTFAWIGAVVIAGAIAPLLGLHSLQPSPGKDTGPAVAGDLKEMLRFGLKGLFGSASPIELLRVDQLVVGLLISPVALGWYTAGVAFTLFPRLIAERIGTVAYPHVAATMDPRAAKETMWKFALIVLLLCLPIVCAIELGAPLLTRLFFGTEFLPAVPIARILVVGALFLSLRRVLSEGLRGCGQPGTGSIAELCSWIVLIPSLPALAARMGNTGVALAMTSAWVMSFIVIALLASFRKTGARSDRGTHPMLPPRSTDDSVAGNIGPET